MSVRASITSFARLAAALAATFVVGAGWPLGVASGDVGWSLGLGSRHGEPDEILSLYTSQPQPIARGLAFRVDEASMQGRRLDVVGEVLNTSGVTYSQVRLVVGVAGGGRQRLTLGKLSPGAGRRVQARLATPSDYRPATLTVSGVDVDTDRRPRPYRW